MNYLVIDVGGTFVKYAIMTETCSILEKSKIPTIIEPLEDFLNSIVRLYERYKDEIEGIALSMPGVIDSKRGFMYHGGSLTCIHNFDIVEYLEKRCQIPVSVANDAKCAGVAEMWRGAIKDCENAVVMVCGTGIGGAVIQNKEVISGEHFMAGEFSYITIETKKEPDANNILGVNSGIPALIHLVSAATQIPEEELDGEKIFEMANAGDERAIQALKEFTYGLAVQINNLQCILDPERFAIGGGISVQPLFLALIKEALKKINDSYPWKMPIPEVTTCRFFNDANLIGALYVHLNNKKNNK